MKLSKIALTAIVALSIGTAAYAETITCNGETFDLTKQTLSSLNVAIEKCYTDKSITHQDLIPMHQLLSVLEYAENKKQQNKEQKGKWGFQTYGLFHVISYETTN